MDIEMLRQFCLALPGTTEDIKWEVHLTFCIAAKMYCIIDLEAEFRVGFKTDPETFEELVQRAGIIPSPHLARNHWIKVVSPGALRKQEWEDALRKSYLLVAAKLTRKQRASLGLP